MRIVYAGAAPPLPGGIAQHGANLVAALRDTGAQVRVESWAAQYPGWLYPGETQDTATEPLPGTCRRLRWWHPGSWHRVGRVARTADALIVPWVTPLQAPAVGTMLRSAGRAKRVIVGHNPLPHERRAIDLPLTRWALAPAQAALVHAEAVRADLLTVLPDIQTFVHPHPPNQAMGRRPAPERPPLRVLFFGYVRPYKGLDVLIEAIHLLRDEGHDVVLTVAGEFWEPVESWHHRVRELRLEDVVDLRPGYVPDGELESLLADHHLVAAPYRSATQSGIIPIAHAAGRVVVASDVGGIAEAVDDGVDGVLVPPSDVRALARGILEAAPLVDGQIGSPSSWSEVADRLLETIRGLPAG